jgi:hypothetical protein
VLSQRVAAAPEEAAPRPVCVAADTCTLVRTVSSADGVQTVTLLERAAPRADAKLPFAGWMAWPHAPLAARTQVWRGGSYRVERPTEAGTFLLRAVPGVKVADEPDSLLVLVTVDPLRPGTAAVLPEAIAIAQERKLLTQEQEGRAARESLLQHNRSKALTNAWLAFARAPTDRTTRTRFLDALGADVSALDAQGFLTKEQRTALRDAGLALEGRIFLEDASSPGVAYRLRVEAAPLEQVVREWNAGLRALVNPLERVPRPLLLVPTARRHEEVSFTLDVKEGDEDRMSQVVRRLLSVPGLSTEGKQLPPPGL